MRIYSLQAPDGNIYDLQAPEGASEQELTATLYSLKPEAAQPFVKESGVIAQGKKGIEQLISGIQTTGGVAFGDKNEAARDALARQAEFDKKYEQSPSLDRTAEAFKQKGFFSGLGQLASDAPEVIAAQIPQFGLSYAGGRTGAAAGSKLGSVLGGRGRAIGAILGGVAGTVGASYPGQLAGNVETQAEEQVSTGKPIDINVPAAAGAAVPQAALDAVANLPFFGRGIFGKMLGIPEAALVRGSAESVERLAKESLAATITKGTTIGFAAEFPTEIIQQAIQRYQAGKPLTGPEAYKEYGEIAYQTALLSPLGTAGRALDKRGAKAQVQQKAYEEQQIADAEAQKATQEVVPPQPQDIAGRYQAAEKRKAELKGQIRKVEEGSVTETADRLYNKELEDQIKEMAPELEQLATEYNQFQKTAPAPEAAAGPEITAPEEIKPTRALTVGDSLDNPLGRFTKEELTSRSPKIAAYVDAQRKKMGKPSLNDYSIEDIRDAMPGQLPEAEKADLNSLIAAKTGHTGEVIYKPQDVVNIAKQKNINTDTVGFKYFLQRATGDNDLSSMSQPQLHSAFKSLSELPKYEETQNLPEKSSATHYSPDQYRKAVDKIKSLTTDGILPSAKAQEVAKQASGLKRDSDVQYMLQSAYRNGDLDLDSNGNFIRVNPVPQSEFRVEEGFEPAEPTGFNVMRGDKVLFSTQNEAEAKAKAKTLGDSAAPTISQVDKSIANEQKTLSASQRSLDAMEANGLFGTPEYNKASAKHTAMVEESAKKVGELNKTKEYLQQEVTVKAGKKAANVKAFTTKEKGVSEKSFATREEALQHAIENHTVARLNKIAAETKSPGLKARISKELERRKGAKPFLAAENPVQEPVQQATKKPTEEPLVTAQKESIKSQLLPMLKKFGLGDVALQIQEAMKEEGSYGASLIKVALDANNPIRVLRHESIHGLKDLGFFTKGQWGVLENQADKVWIDKYLKERNIDGRPLEAGQQSRYDAYYRLYKGDMRAVREEAIADAFGDFDLNGAPKGVFTTLLNNMRQFFEALRNSFNGAGYMTSDDVFGKIERGELSAGKKAAGKERLSVRELQKGIVAEVAPNPDQEIAKQWDSMSQADKLATTKSVTNKVVKNVLDELGLEGYKVEYSTGTYEGKLNPNILISAPKNASIDELTELSKVIGYVLDQKAMVSYDETNTSSNSQAGFVKVNLPKGMNDEDLTRLRNHISKEVAQADADTLRDGSLLYGNFSEFNDRVPTLSDEQYHSKILDAVSSFDYDGKIQVSDPVKFHSELAWPDNRMGYLEGTRYGTSGTDSSTEGANVRRIGRSNLDNISSDAITLRNRWIESAARPEQPAVRPSRGSDEGISLGEKQKNALAFDGIHYGRSKTPVLMGSMSGSGLKGAEKDRLAGSSDGRIKKRAYFYIERPDGSMPMVESGVGNQVHTQSLNNILGPGAEMRRISAASKGDFNKFESGVVDAGYDGYASPDMGMMVILNHDVPTTYQGTVADLKASGRLKNNRIVGERSSLRSESYGLNVLNDIEETPDFGKKPTVDQVAQHFDKEIQDRFGRKLDYNNPEDMARAVKMASDELESQIKSQQSGLDWYDQDIKKAFKDTAEVIPSLKKEPKRQIFSVMAGILSPQTNARDNWFIAAKAFEHYEKTGTVLGTNPETGGLWQGGTQSANKKKQMEFLDSMIKDLGEKKTLAWLNGKHSVKEINDYRRKYGKLSSGIDGKATDEKPGFYAFGPKVGPFVSNINGIHDVTVDKWATRTFNRYFGTMADANGSIIDAPTEAQRRAVKELMNGVAKDANIKNYQVQSALWFYEQKLFRKLGTDSPSYGFSQGSGKFLEQRGGRGGSEGRGTAESASPESKLSLRTAPDTPEFKRFFGDSRVVNADGTPKVLYHGSARDIGSFKRKTDRGAPIFLTDDPTFAEKFSKDSMAWMTAHPDQFLTETQIKEGRARAIVAIRKDFKQDTQGKEMIDSLKSGKYGDATAEAQEYLRKAYKDMMPSGPNIVAVYVKAEKPFDYQNPSHVKRVLSELSDGEDMRKDVQRGSWETIESESVQDAIKFAGFDSFYVEEGGRKNLAVYDSSQIKSATGNVGAYGQRPITKEEAARSGMTQEEAQQAQAEGDIRYSLREFRKDDLPKDKKTYTIPANTTLFHGSHKTQAEQIETSGGYTNEGGLIFFGDSKTAEDWAKNRGDPMSVKFDQDAGVIRDTGTVFQTITDRPYQLIKRRYELSASEAAKVTEALGLPEYKSLSAGDTASLAADRGDNFSNSKAPRYEVTKSGRKQTMSAPWPIIFDALGVDGYFDDFGVAISAKNGIRLEGNDGKMERFSLRTNVTEDIKNMPNGAAIDAAINRTTQTRQEVGFVERITEALAPESFSYLRQKGLDRYNRLNDVERLVAKKMGGVERLADSNAHAAALQSDLAAGVAASALGVGDRIGGIPVYKDGYTTVSNENGTIKGAVAIFAPLARYGDPKMYQTYQFWAASKRGKRLLASGKEELFTQQEFAYAKQLEQKYPEFVSVQKDWIKYNDGLVKYLLDTGVISAQNAAEFVKYSDYLPFYRQIDGERTIGPNIFQSISGVKAPKGLSGKSEAPLADFLETIVRNTQASIQAGMKNVAAKKAADAGVSIGMVEKLDHVSSSPSTITILEKGKKVSYECADRLWVDAVSSLNLPELPFLSIFAKPADLLRNLITKDPGFMLANLMRDSVSAYVTSGAKITPLVSTMKEFGSVLMNSSPEYQKLLSAGVLGGYEFSRDIEASTSEFAKDIRKKTGTKTALETATSPFTLFWGALEKGTTASDAATRIAIYKATLKETGNEAEALHRSLEVLNFNRKGSSAVVRIAAAVIPFLNARVQGLDVFFRSGIRPFFNKDATAMEKQVQKAMFIRGSTIMAMSAMYAAAIAGNPDYENQEEEVKDNNWIIPLGEGRAPLKIPIPFEVGTLFKTVPERIYRSFYGMDTNKDSAEAAKRALSNTFGISPLPQFIAPYYEVKSNYSLFTGREIVSGNMKDVAPEYQVGANTSKVAQELGMATGMSPMKLEYLYKGYTGTMGMYALDLLDASITSLMPDSGVQRASKRFEQMPVIKRFLADPEARGKITAYYDLKNSVDSVVRTVNFLEKSNDPTIAQYVEKNAMLYAAKDFINDLNKQMQDLQDQANMVRSADIPPDEKREILLEITKAQNLLVNDIRAIRKVIQP
jgi:hypothetical protein